MATIKYAGEEAIRTIADYVNQKLKFVSSMPESPETNTLVLYIGSNTASYLQGGVYKYDGTNWNLINLVKTIELTQAEYNALPSAVQNNGTIYFITDAGSSDTGKEIVKGYLNPIDRKFYVESTYTTEISPNVDVLYIDLSTDYLYIYDSANTTYIKVGGGSQAQADWNQSDNSQVDYIKNKPDLSTKANTSDVGTLSSLKTTTKTNLVAAINELYDSIDTMTTEIEAALEEI